mmetsp:Transcript_68058/g.181129  ORF Transcript_68058/g.181129 Transcript_68058/m.181129 type:complete len:100 (-) Transcript_68058:71-370(-)
MARLLLLLAVLLAMGPAVLAAPKKTKAAPAKKNCAAGDSRMCASGSSVLQKQAVRTKRHTALVEDTEEDHIPQARSRSAASTKEEASDGAKATTEQAKP